MKRFLQRQYNVTEIEQKLTAFRWCTQEGCFDICLSMHRNRRLVSKYVCVSFSAVEPKSQSHMSITNLSWEQPHGPSVIIFYLVHLLLDFCVRFWPGVELATRRMIVLAGLIGILIRRFTLVKVVVMVANGPRGVAEQIGRSHLDESTMLLR